jgi:hypothetical protein
MAQVLSKVALQVTPLKNENTFIKRCSCGLDLYGHNSRFDGTTHWGEFTMHWYTCNLCKSTCVVREQKQ